MIYSRTQMLVGSILGMIILVIGSTFLNHSAEKIEILALTVALILVALKNIFQKLDFRKYKAYDKLDDKINELPDREFKGMIIFLVIVFATLMFLMNGSLT